MGIASGFLLQTCSRTRYGQSDGMYGRAAGATITGIACRLTQQQKEKKLPDGSLWISTARMMVEDTDIVVGDAITADNGNKYIVKLVEETRNLTGDIEIKTVWME
jgi:hypothetical protein